MSDSENLFIFFDNLGFGWKITEEIADALQSSRDAESFPGASDFFPNERSTKLK